jgi:hypothetical protein
VPVTRYRYRGNKIPWRAGCGRLARPVRAGGPGKRTSGDSGTEPRADPHKGLGLDENQVGRWDSWYRHTTPVMLAHAVLTVIAAPRRPRTRHHS